MTIDEWIETSKLNAKVNREHPTDEMLLQEAEEYDQLAEWLEELKLYRLAIKQCKESSCMVNSKEFAKHMEEWVKEQLKQVE